MSWQPIETAPKDGASVLLTDGLEVASARWMEEVPPSRGTYPSGGGWNDPWGIPARWATVRGPLCVAVIAPTHWMPLPETPK